MHMLTQTTRLHPGTEVTHLDVSHQDFHSRHTHVDAHPGSLVHTFIRLTLRTNTYPTRSLLGANAPRGCAPDCSFGCWGGWLGWAVPQGSFFSAPHPVPTLPSPLCPADNLKKRIANINHYLTYNLYSNVCRSLFEKHKLMFAFLLCARIMMNQGKINQVRGREGATARSRTDGLRGCPVAELTEQGGRTGHIRQEGTARADGQRPPETVICVKPQEARVNCDPAGPVHRPSQHLESTSEQRPS